MTQYCKIILPYLLLTVISFKISFGQEITKTGANIIQADRTATYNNAAVWVVPAEQKIRPKDNIENDNLIWNKKLKRINVAGAGNEHAPFQIVLTVPVQSGSGTNLDKFHITSSNLRSRNGKIIPKEQLQFYLEHYIMLTGISSPMGGTGYWPDALAPIKEPFSMAAQYGIVQNRPVWADLNIPASTPAGIYTGTIIVSQNEKRIDTLNLEVEVYRFSLPEKTHLITYMDVSKESLANFYHMPSASGAIDTLTQIYYDFLYDHRMEPWFNDQLQPEVSLIGESVKVNFNDARYHYYLNKLHTNRVLLNAFPSSLKKLVRQKEFSSDFNKIIKDYLTQIVTYFKRNGWEDHLVFNSPIDEPNTSEDYEKTRQWAALVHGVDSRIPFLATESPVPDDASWGTLVGNVNNFSIHGNALNDPEVKKTIIEEQNKGGEITWYISCDQKYPQPNYFIDASALDPVMIPWITARYHMEGILYWATNFWAQTVNPWLNANTFISGFECSGGYILNGEGSLLYPGDFTKNYTGQPNVYGPISSIRLELLRAGIEDYEYMWMLKNLGDIDFVEKQIKSLVIDVSSFSRNMNELYTARRIMARRVEELLYRKGKD